MGITHANQMTTQMAALYFVYQTICQLLRSQGDSIESNTNRVEYKYPQKQHNFEFDPSFFFFQTSRNLKFNSNPSNFSNNLEWPLNADSFNYNITIKHVQIFYSISIKSFDLINCCSVELQL